MVMYQRVVCTSIIKFFEPAFPPLAQFRMDMCGAYLRPESRDAQHYARIESLFGSIPLYHKASLANTLLYYHSFRQPDLAGGPREEIIPFKALATDKNRDEDPKLWFI